MRVSVLTVGLLLVLASAAVSANDVQQTQKGCECDSPCGTSLDGGFYAYEWCYTKNRCGKFSATKFKYWDICVKNPDTKYEEQPARDKQAMSWAMIMGEAGASSKFPSALELLGLFKESVRVSFDRHSDAFPAGRKKFIHSVGATAKVSFVSNGKHKYTGLFKGASSGLLRLSAAKQPTEDNIAPGFGLKFFRNGTESANLVAMPSLTGQSSFDIFENDYNNHVPYPKSDFALKLVAKKFTQASNCPLMVGVSDLAAVGEDGVYADDVVFPWRLTFRPTGKIHFPVKAYDVNGFLGLLEGIPAPTTLFNVYAMDSPNAEGVVPIGEIKMDSLFFRSTYGDEKLFFRHQYMEADFCAKPRWMDDIDYQKMCGTDDASTTPPGKTECPIAA